MQFWTSAFQIWALPKKRGSCCFTVLSTYLYCNVCNIIVLFASLLSAVPVSFQFDKKNLIFYAGFAHLHCAWFESVCMIYDTALCCIIGTLSVCLFATLAFADDYPALQHTNAHDVCTDSLLQKYTLYICCIVWCACSGCIRWWLFRRELNSGYASTSNMASNTKSSCLRSLSSLYSLSWSSKIFVKIVQH